MIKSRLLIVIILFLFSCGTKHSKTATTQTASKKINWVNETLGIADYCYLADTALRTDDNLFAYGTYIRLPKLTHQSGEFEKLNQKIASDFESIINDSKANPKPDSNKYHKVFYNYYLNDSIISLKITDLHAYHLSEATTAFQVYHFDFRNNKILNTPEIFELLGLSQVPVLSAFAEQCTLPPDHTDPLFNPEWFNRVKWNDLNQLKFYQNQDKHLVIIYPVAENGIEAELLVK
jgi:hypothetical protein